MRKLFYAILLLSLTFSLSYGGTITLPQTWSTGDSVTAAKKNSELNAIVNEVNGGLDNSNADTTNGYRFYEVKGTIPSAGTEGRIVYLTSDDLLHLDDGSQWMHGVFYTGTAAQGDIIYYNGTDWTRLAAGTANYPLVTNGASANPAYEQIVTAAIANDAVTFAQIDDDGNFGAFTGSWEFDNINIDGGTVDGITSLTAAGHLDIGAYNFRAINLFADSIPSGRVILSTTSGQLTSDTDLTFATDTLTVTKIAAFSLTGKLTAGATEIEGSAFDIDGGDISGGTISGGLTWNAAQNLNSQALTNVNMDSGDISAGTISGGLTWSAAQNLNSQALTNVNIDSGAIDGVTLGGASAVTITDMDCNGGTLDGVQIGGTTATGELIVNNASDDADGLGSQGTSGQVLTSAGAGANPTFSDAPISLVSTTTMSNATNSGDIAISSGSFYLVRFVVEERGSGACDVEIRFNSDSGSNYDFMDAGGSAGAAQDSIMIETIGANSIMQGEFTIQQYPNHTDEPTVSGHAFWNNSGSKAGVFGGQWDNNTTPTSFEIITALAVDGSITVYKMNTSQ